MDDTSPATAGKTFTLAVPVTDDKGNTYSTITLVEPELRHQKEVERQSTAGGMAQAGRLIAVLSGLPAEAVSRLKLRDVKAIQGWMSSVRQTGVAGDIIAEAYADPLPLPNALAILAATDAYDLPQYAQWVEAARTIADAATTDELNSALATPWVPIVESVRTFVLGAPVSTNAAPITELTATEPDLQSAIAVESFKRPSEQTGALITAVTKSTIPVIDRMKMSDVERIDRWLSFFLRGGAASPPAPTAPTIETPTTNEAGAT